MSEIEKAKKANEKANLEGKLSIGYKVVTEELKSLGLRRNPNIVKFPINEWYSLPKENVAADSNDFGGIWVARTLSAARGLQRYIQKHYNRKTRIFRSYLGRILYNNSYRIKTDRIRMFEEIR